MAQTVSAATGAAPQEVASQAASQMVTGRFTRPDEVADLVLFLASDRASGDRCPASYQPSSLSRLSSMPKWWAISWMTVRRTWPATSGSVRQIAQIAWR